MSILCAEKANCKSKLQQTEMILIFFILRAQQYSRYQHATNNSFPVSSNSFEQIEQKKMQFSSKYSEYECKNHKLQLK